MGKTKKSNEKIELTPEQLWEATQSINYMEDKRRQDNADRVSNSLLGGVIPEVPIEMSTMNPAPMPLPRPMPKGFGVTPVASLPSTQGGTAVPAISASMTPPSNVVRQSHSTLETRPMNMDLINEAKAQQIEENKKAETYNSAITPVAQMINSKINSQTNRSDTRGLPIPDEYVPVLPLPRMPKNVDIPNMVTGSFSQSESFYEKSRGGVGSKPEPDLQVYALKATGVDGIDRTMQSPKDASSPMTWATNYNNNKSGLASGIIGFSGDVFPGGGDNVKGMQMNVPVRKWKDGKFVEDPNEKTANMVFTDNIPKDLARLVKINAASMMTGRDFSNAWFNPSNGTRAGGMLIHAANMQANYGQVYGSTFQKAIEKTLDDLGFKRTGIVKNSYADKILANNDEYQKSKGHSEKQRWVTAERNEVAKMILLTLKAEGLGVI